MIVFARTPLASVLRVGSLAALALPLAAQTAPTAQQGWSAQQVLHTETYVKPPDVIERIIMAPRTDISFTAPSPDRKWFVRTIGADRGDVAEFGKEHINLGGLQIETKANRARTLTTSTRRGLTLIDPRTMATRVIETPKDASISSPTWSPSGTQIAYIANADEGSYLYVADVASGKAQKATRSPLLATLVTSVEWAGDNALVLVIVPDVRGAVPVYGNKGIADGPEVRLTESRALPQVIHASLLENPYDRARLKYYTTGQLAVIDLKSRRLTKIGAPAMIKAVDASPDAKFVRVTKMTEPFSYVVPVSSFGSMEELWDIDGKVITSLAKTPLREGERGGDGDTPAAGGRGGAQQTASDTGKRNIRWNPIGTGLVYMQSEFAAAGSGSAAASGNSGRGGRGAGGRGTQTATAQRPQPTSVKYVNWLPPFGPTDTKVIYEGSGQFSNLA
ncbi:MAG: DPP IV N-terminal domain-containing protein [bacterium]